MGLVYGAVGLVALLWVTRGLYALGWNYRAARATGLPLVVCPYDPDRLVHTILSEPLRPVLRFLLPAAAYQVFELSTYGWEFRDKGAVHERLGPIFIVVTTGLNRLVCADPSVGQTILARRKDFVHPDISIQAMGILGSNIITNNEKDWSRQRRIVAPALSERISAGVWAESGEQAEALADVLLAASASAPGGGGSADTIPGLRAVAINVLTHIAYGRRKPFALPSASCNPVAALSYVDAISLVTELLVVAAFAPVRLLKLPVMPLALQTLGVALERLPTLAREMLDRERHESLGTAPEPARTSDTIMRTLVRLSDQQKEQAANGAPSSSEKLDTGTGGSASKSYLTEDEMAGNLFIFTAAGFDTTANTMAYAVALLAACPEWQTWVQEELDEVLGPASPGDGAAAPLPDYETNFPKLVRCLAVMLETLRLYPPVTLLMRSTPASQLISADGAAAAGLPSSFRLSGPCAVHVNTMALHTARAAWGADALEFRPTRWLRANDDGATPGLVTPPRGVFLPWSLGPRACPGQKMSQVEFVAVVATLLRRAAVEAVSGPGPGRGAAQARRHLLNQTQDSQPVLTLQMNRPQDVWLRWVPREVLGRV